MGRGQSKAGGGGGGGTQQDFPEAFAPGKDFLAVNGVNHVSRTVSRTTQAEWDKWSAPLNSGTTAADEADIMRDWNPRIGLTGYVRTQNSFVINEKLYDPKNDGKPLDKIFSKKEDVNTIRTLDRLIDSHKTQADASYTRFTGPNAVQATFGLTNSQMSLLKQAPNMNAAQLKKLNENLSGYRSFNPSFTSTSANRSLNAFSNPNAKQSKGFIYERKINVKKGTKAYAPRKNAQESEVIFGRNAYTKLVGISIASDGHIVLHEEFNGYK